MPNRKRNIQMKFYVTEEEKALIMIWFYVVGGLGFVVMMGLHLKARNE